MSNPNESFAIPHTAEESLLQPEVTNAQEGDRVSLAELIGEGGFPPVEAEVYDLHNPPPFLNANEIEAFRNDPDSRFIPIVG